MTLKTLTTIKTQTKRLSILAALLAASVLSSGEAYADSFEAYMHRCSTHRETVERILEEEGVPTEYFALLLAESGCDIRNVSDKGAKGAWQLTDATARTYGVTDPYDLEQSTRGAARYLKSLIGRFRSMRWVVAAYNAGGTNLKRVTGYPDADFSVVRRVRPEAYYLSIKVRDFVRRIKAHDTEREKLPQPRQAYESASKIGDREQAGDVAKRPGDQTVRQDGGA